MIAKKYRKENCAENRTAGMAQSETQRNIRRLEDMLPKARAKMMAVLWMTVISAVLLVSSAFAWVTLSTNPEVTGVSTTVAANGSLEIALSDTDGLEPETSAVGDSSSAQSVKAANLTWGNLVNLSDGYGLEELTLRPATLSTAYTALLKGVDYGTDGRASSYTSDSDFAFALWQEATTETEAAWVVPTETMEDESGNETEVVSNDYYGVRAITTVTYENLSATSELYGFLEEAANTQEQVKSSYQAIIGNSTYVNILTGLMGAYLGEKMSTNGNTSTLDVSTYVSDLYAMMADFLTVLRQEGEVYTALANAQALSTGESFTFDTLMAASETQLAAAGVSLTSLAEYKSDYNQLVKDVASMLTLKNAYENDGTTITWSQISSMLNRLVTINTTTIGGTKISSITIGNASNYTSGTQEVVIQEGSIYNFEGRNGTYMYAKGVSVTAKVYLGTLGTQTQTVTANIYTAQRAAGTNTYSGDYTEIRSSDTSGWPGTDPTAEETYAFAVDLWVRTNAEGSVLTLQSNVQTTSTQSDVTVTVDNTEYTVYTVTYTDESGTSVSVDAVTDDDLDSGVITWYTFDTGALVAITGDVTRYVKQVEIDTQTVAAENADNAGANRVWQDSDDLDENSTTQGNGSVYVLYADTPEQANTVLELMGNMKIAFLDSSNNLLATAVFNTEYSYSSSGKYYIPITIESGGQTYTNEDGTESTGITALVANEAMRITMVVYLDGTNLSNTQVLAAEEITGNLNIQFGSSVSLDTVGNSELKNATRTVTATASPLTFDYDECVDNGSDMTTIVSVKVSGTEASTMTGFFLRSITSTQGTRQDTMTFTYDDEKDVWTADYTFAAPGTYILRSLTIDGAEIDLDEPVTVEVSGYNVSSITCSAYEILSTERTGTTELAVTFATSDKAAMPQTVQAVFVSESGRYQYADLSYDGTGGTWSGTATFSTSGTYTLEYLILDGNYTAVTQDVVVTVTLGIRVSVYLVHLLDEADYYYETLYDSEGNEYTALRTTQSLDYLYTPGQNENFRVQLTVTDDQGNILSDLGTIEKLVYLREGSALESNGMVSANLTWSDEYGCYVGEGTVSGTGTWKFSYVSVLGNSVTATTSASVIRASTATPPSYVAESVTAVGASDGYIFASENDATFTVEISDAGAPTSVTAVFGRSTGKGRSTAEQYESSYIDVVTDSETGISTYTFAVPTTLNSDTGEYTQDGTWELTAIKIGGVYDSDMVEYTDENPWELIISDSPEIKVVVTVYASFADGQTWAFGEDEDLYFMDEQTLTSDLVITDYEGAAIEDVSDVSLTLAFTEGSNEDYGGYTSEDLSVEDIILSYSAEESGDGSAYTASAALKVAGEYAAQEFSLTVGDVTYTWTISRSGSYEYTTSAVHAVLDGQAPYATLTTQLPTVTVTGTNPEAGVQYYVNLGSSTNEYYIYFSNYYEDYYVLIGHQAESSSCSASYTASQVTMKLTGAGSNFSEASYTVQDTTAAYDYTMSWSANNTESTAYMNSVGGGQDSASGASTRYSVNATFETIDMTYQGVTYTVEITNPVQIKTSNGFKPQITYAEPDNYSLLAGSWTLPETDDNNGRGTAFSVTLDTDEVEVFTIDDGSDYPDQSEMTKESSESSTEYVYTSVTSSSSCGGSTTTYTNYARTTTTTVYNWTGELNGTLDTYELTSWLVQTYSSYDTSTTPCTIVYNTGTTYTAPKTLTVSNPVLATPTFELVSSESSTGQGTIYLVVTTVQDVKTGTSTSSGTGTAVDSVDTAGTTTSYYTTNEP
ncbi:MAG: hypothetical protein LUE90_08545 [Clostridiales bacterium]|nr:hypothetical protein [Clostridiales bacterium]